MTFSRFALAVAVGIGLPGCFSSSSGPPPLGGLDGGDLDSTVDQTAPPDTGALPEAAGPDAAGDAPMTASPEAGGDASDASPEAGADATVAASDAGDSGAVVQDAASDGSPCPATDAGLPQTRCNGVCVDTSSDPANCGACSNVCPVPTTPSTGTCALGGCLVTLATGIDFPSGIAVDSANVYFSNSNISGPNAVVRVPKAGGTPTTLLPAGGVALGSLAVDSANVYVTENGDGFTANLVVATPLDGGIPSTLASVPASSDPPADIRVDSTNVYFGLSEYGDGRIFSAPLDGGATSTLASGDHYPNFLTIDNAYVYFTETSSNGSIFQVPLADGGAPLALATGQYSPSGIAVDTTSVYWGTYGGCAADSGTCGVVQKAPIGGGAAVTLATGVTSPAGMAVDSTYVYWTDWVSGNGGACTVCDGVVMRAPIDGSGVATTLAVGQENPLFVKVDSSGIYWINSGPTPGGSVMKLTLP